MVDMDSMYLLLECIASNKSVCIIKNTLIIQEQNSKEIHYKSMSI